LFFDLRESFLRDENFTRRSGALQSRRGVHRVAEHGVVGDVLAAR
jgi:hypothetical protein